MHIILPNMQTRSLINKVLILNCSLARRILNLNNTKTSFDIIAYTDISPLRTLESFTGFMYL